MRVFHLVISPVSVFGELVPVQVPEVNTLQTPYAVSCYSDAGRCISTYHTETVQLGRTVRDNILRDPVSIAQNLRVSEVYVW